MATIKFEGLLKIEKKKKKGYAKLTVWYDGFTLTARGKDMAYTLPNDKFVKMQVAYVDSHGNPATVDGAVAWSSSDSTIVTVAADASDSTIVTVTPVGAIGQAQVVATADADLGSGVTTLVTTCDVQVVAGQAVAGTITPVGEPQPLP